MPCSRGARNLLSAVARGLGGLDMPAVIRVVEENAGLGDGRVC